MKFDNHEMKVDSISKICCLKCSLVLRLDFRRTERSLELMADYFGLRKCANQIHEGAPLKTKSAKTVKENSGKVAPTFDAAGNESNPNRKGHDDFFAFHVSFATSRTLARVHSRFEMR